MDASSWYLALSAWGLLWTASAWFGFRHLGPLLAPYFMISWITGELAYFHVGWQMLATAAFAFFGGLEGTTGALGLALSFVSWVGLAGVQHRASFAAEAFEASLREGLGADFRREVPERRAGLQRQRVEPRDWSRPFSFSSDGVEVVRGLSYGPAGKRNELEVVRPARATEAAPVLLQIHGGAWMIGEKEQQGRPLMTYLAERGWVCVAINYRLSPRARFPDHLVDAKRAMKWIRENIANYGGDPDWVAVTGGSAGGHLSSLFALTANDPRYQPGFEDVDTRVQAAVPFYGIYDFADRQGVRGRSAMLPMLERYVMPVPLLGNEEEWDRASPVCWVGPEAPPFFVIHGDHDALAFVEDARLFSGALRGVSSQPVVYAEVPYAQHAFDVFHSERSAHAVGAVSWFLEWVRAREGVPAATRETGS
jgi:acetyl esterase/lipase